MKQLLFIVLMICSWSVFAQKENKAEKAPSQKEYEMEKYWFVMLTKGEKRGAIKDTVLIAQMQKGHLANITRLAEEGKILVAGPFGDDGNWRGIFIFDAASKEEVETLLNTDPMIAAGWLGYEIHPWWTAKNSVFK